MRIAGAILLGSLSLTLLPAAQQEPPAKKTKDSGGPPGGPPPFGPGGFGGQQRKLVKQFDKDGDGRLNQEERRAARDFLKKQGASGRPGGFGPGNFLAGPLREKLDTDKDGKLTKEELLAGVKQLFAECDKDKKGSLDENQIAQGLGRIIPQPPGFPGGPPGGPGGPPGGRGGRGGPGGGPGGPPGGPPGGRGGPPQPGQIMPAQLQDRLKLTDEQKKQVAALQKEVDAKLAAILSEEERKSLQQMRQRFGGFRGFGPGNFLAGGIVRRADADKDGKVTLTELTAAAEKLFQEADKDKDGNLDQSELVAAFGLLAPAPGFGPPGGFGGRGNREPPKPGPRLSPEDVKAYPRLGLYDETILRTLFLEFEDKNWEAELADFKGTDVEVPATLTVDGKKYPGVGVHFRGMSSYMMVQAGSKRSINLALDFANSKQRLHGYKTLNLLNAHEDGTFMSTVLYSHIARQYIPAPRANFVQLVINGESWGVYVNAQQFNKEFVAENFKGSKGARWKVRGSPGGGGLEYLGDNIEDYKRRYEIKSGDSPKAWRALIDLCKTLNQTPPDKLEQALAAKMDLDGLLWFLALDMALINDDGYWIRASDYSIYLDGKGKFHVIPHDINEAFRPAGGPGFGGPGGFGMAANRLGEIVPPPQRDMLRLGDDKKQQIAKLQTDAEEKVATILTDDQKAKLQGPRAGEPRSPVDLDPLIGLDDARKPLRSKVLAVPALRQRYLQHVRAIADKWLDWKNLGPVVAQYRSLIEKGIESDTRKLSTLAEFQKLTADTAEPEANQGRRMNMSLRSFADQRRHYLLNYSESKRP